VLSRCRHRSWSIVELTEVQKYVFLEKSYEPDDEDERPAKAGASRPRSISPPKCTLHPSVRSLTELIFNNQYFEAAMQSYNYDVHKLPLGKLSKSTILRGYQALKDLSAILDSPSVPVRSEVEDLSNLYYSLIPHVSAAAVRVAMIYTC
jgi:poly [ADP-ribose] polymerase 2/3/4